MKYFKGQGPVISNKSYTPTRRLYKKLSSVRREVTPAKYRYLPEVTNRNQMVLKEMFTTETRYSDNWKRRLTKNLFFPKQDFRHKLVSNDRPSSRSSQATDYEPEIRNNLRMLGISADSAVFNPMLRTKTQIRNRSFDPIMGHEKEYRTPPIVLRSLGGNTPDHYYYRPTHY